MPNNDGIARLEQVRLALEALGCQPSQSEGSFTAKCPAHDDNKPSLSVDLAGNGRVLIYCFAGCKYAAIVERLGLDRSVFNPGLYPYTTEGGAVRYVVERREGKRFSQWRIDEGGQRVDNIDGVERLLYNAPEVSKADPALPVFVVEGEKDAETLMSHGLLAVTHSGGANGPWPHELARELLAGRDVICLPDNDDPGRAHSKRVAESLHGVARSVRVVELPGLADKGDVSDWLAERSRDARINEDGRIVTRGRDELLALIAGAAQWTSHVEGATLGGEWVFDGPTDLEPLWGTADQCLWARGEALILAGNTGVGKTTLGQQVMLGLLGLRDRVLGMPVTPATGKVLYLALDRPRQARRSLRRMVRLEDREVLQTRLVVLDTPLRQRIENDPAQFAALAERHGASHVIVDSLKDTSSNLADNAVGAQVALSFQMTIAAGVELMVFHHHRKGNGENPRSIDDLYGSSQITNTAGSVVALWGKAGDVVVELRHLKQPAEEVGPLKIVHDFDRGESRILDKFDVFALLSGRPEGMTARDVAESMLGNPSPTPNEVEKARRQLRRVSGLVEVGQGTRADPHRWRVLGVVAQSA